jgi:beta-galactosidase
VEILDKDGNVVPTAGNQIDFTVEGNATLAGVDNGNPVSHESFKGTTIKAFNGKCLAVIQAGELQGKIQLTASGIGLERASLSIISK